MTTEVSNELFEFDPRKALVWPRKNVLAIADIHFGKSSTFQNHGYWLPEEAELNDVARIEGLIRDHQIEVVLFLGDFAHSGEEFSPAVEAAVHSLNQNHPQVNFILVVGNHDLHFLKKWPEAFSFIERADEVLIDGIRFVHEAEHDDATEGVSFTWYGHVHPVVKLSKGPELLRLPVFWLEQNRGCLPAFSSLAGGFEVPLKPKSRLFAVTLDEVVPLG